MWEIQREHKFIFVKQIHEHERTCHIWSFRALELWTKYTQNVVIASLGCVWMDTSYCCMGNVFRRLF